MSEAAPARQSRSSWLRWTLVTVPGVLLPGLASARLGDSGLGNFWFAQLAKPAIMPPGWMFPFAWSVLFIMMGVALALILATRSTKGRDVGVTLFLVQFALSLAWLPVFFAMHRIMLAFGLIIAIAFWAAITTIIFWHIRRIAALLMLPWLAWLLFVGYLNWQVHLLNPWGPALLPSTGATRIIIQ